MAKALLGHLNSDVRTSAVLTVENREQAEARIDKAAEAVRSALEMADVFSQLRASAAGPLH